MTKKIAFCGAKGVGKTTAIKYLKEELINCGFEVRAFEKPTLKFSRILELEQRDSESWVHGSYAKLYSLTCFIEYTVRFLIRYSFTRKNKILLFDRFWLCFLNYCHVTGAISSIKIGLFLRKLFLPDIIVLLEVDTNTINNRARIRNSSTTNIEESSLAQQLQAQYMNTFKRYDISYVTIENTGTEEDLRLSLGSLVKL